MSPRSWDIAAVLADYAEDKDTRRALARLHKHLGHPVSADLLADAVTATRTLRDLADGTADPVLLTDGAATSPWIDRRAMAEAQAQDALETALGGLLRAGVA